jgi:hypothetical protein
MAHLIAKDTALQSLPFGVDDYRVECKRQEISRSEKARTLRQQELAQLLTSLQYRRPRQERSGRLHSVLHAEADAVPGERVQRRAHKSNCTVVSFRPRQEALHAQVQRCLQTNESAPERILFSYMKLSRQDEGQQYNTIHFRCQRPHVEGNRVGGVIEEQHTDVVPNVALAFQLVAGMNNDLGSNRET